MTYNPNLPLSSDKIRAFPGDVTTNNWPRLTANFGADHEFDNASAATQGYHTTAHWVKRAGAIGDGTPAQLANVAQLYTKSLEYRKAGNVVSSTRQVLMMQPGSGVANAEEVAIGAAPIRAAVSFDPAGNILGSAYNVSTVTFDGVNRYTLNFVTPMPLNTYIVNAVISNPGTGAQVIYVFTKNTTDVTLQTQLASGAFNVTGGLDVIVLGGWALT